MRQSGNPGDSSSRGAVIREVTPGNGLLGGPFISREMLSKGVTSEVHGDAGEGLVLSAAGRNRESNEKNKAYIAEVF